MLSALSIQDFVLIDRLTLEGGKGLCALTGETGAGKSILLDALGFALGARAESGMVRHGADQASVTAAFDLPAKHPLHAFLKEKDIVSEDGVVLRRTLGRDGRGKAFINDAPVSVQLLKETGAALVEIHGQFATQGLLDPVTHRAALDLYAGLDTEVIALRSTWVAWREAEKKLEQALSGIEAARTQEDYLRHVVAELEDLDPRPGEEDTLAKKRTALLNAGKMQGALEQAGDLLESESGIQGLIGRLQSLLEKTGEAAAPALEAVLRAKAEAEDAAWQVERLKSGAGGGENLAAVEDRYFALKAAAKKHRCIVDDLPRLQGDMAAKLRLITHQEDAVADLEKSVAAGRRDYTARAEKISAARAKTAQKLAKAVQAELPELKLGRAEFFVESEKAEEGAWGPDGIDRVRFLVSTNPPAPAAPLNKVASGGEMSRFMLALKTVLAAAGSVPTLIFDEVDSGIGGATADAVGECLARLAKKYQVLVVTHSPQVAARASQHWHVAKAEKKGAVTTSITPLTAAKDRQEEIARMLSGAEVTKEARAQAARLLKAKDAA